MPTTANVVASWQERPMILQNSLGRGRVVSAIPQIEQMIATFSAERVERDRWTQWYRGMLETLQTGK